MNPIRPKYLPLRESFSKSELIKHYGDFYKNQTVLKINEVSKELNLSCGFQDENTLCIKKSPELTNWDIKRKIFSKNYFLAIPRIKNSSSDNEFLVSIELNSEDELIPDNYFEEDLIQIAERHADPVKFLIDHKKYWIGGGKVLSFLTEKKYLEEPGVLDVLEHVLSEKETSVNVRIKGILVLGNALQIPSLKTKAKSLLLNLSVFDGFHYTSFFPLRELAWKQLLSLSESDVFLLFEKIAEEDPCLPNRFEILNYIENLNDYKIKLDIEIQKQMISQFNIESLDEKEGRLLDYILWHNLPYSYQALVELGEELFTKAILKQFLSADIETPSITKTQQSGIGDSDYKFSKSVHLYSLLKFVGFNTTNEGILSEILTAFSNVLEGKELGLLDTPSYIVTTLNERLTIKKTELTPFENIDPQVKSQSAFNINPRKEDSRSYKSKKIEVLISIIQSEKIEIKLKLVAIRSCAKYLFPDYEVDWIRKEFLDYSERIVKGLEVLNQKNTSDEVLNEVSKLLSLYKTQNNKVI